MGLAHLIPPTEASAVSILLFTRFLRLGRLTTRLRNIT